MQHDEIAMPVGGMRFSGARQAPPAGRYRFVLLCVFSAFLALAVVGCATTSKEPERKLTRADKVVVKKSERKLQLIQSGQVVREYRIALGQHPRGHKMEQGDERTPEGDYILDWRNPYSRFYKSIHVSYPNERDIQFASFVGMDPGGMIMIHGQPDYIQSPRLKAAYKTWDWTDGCIAVQNHDMDEIWRAVRDGTPIQIQP